MSPRPILTLSAQRARASEIERLGGQRELTAAELAEYEQLAKLAHLRRLSAHGRRV